MNDQTISQFTHSIYPFLILTALYVLVIVGVVATLLTAMLRIERGHSASLRDIFRQSRFLELTTVLVIIITASYLALAGRLDQGIVSLLSGVAGYVLGGLAAGNRKGSDEA